MKDSFTRGHGFLEGFLSKQRAKIANNSISDSLRDGRILDLGCGYYPYFLSSIKFKEKFGLNNSFAKESVEGINLINHDFYHNQKLPFDDSFFNVVTLLAVLEHLDNQVAISVLTEAYRVLAVGGNLIITVPWGKTDLLLKFLSKIKLVSAVEINEHKQLYNESLIKNQLLFAGFEPEKIKIKRFEFGLNLFILAKK